MLRLISELEGKAKQVIAAIVSNGIFYATANTNATKNIRKINFGDILLVAHLKTKSVFDSPQTKTNGRMGLGNFHQHFKICNFWLCSIGYEAPLLLNENIAESLTCLAHNRRNDFYKATKKK